MISSMLPWNDWYHCTTHTYGSWLRGDRRGWRARHHREHVQGDYKNPAHFQKATEYIHDHLSRGAVIWEPDPIRDFIEMPLPE